METRENPVRLSEQLTDCSGTSFRSEQKNKKINYDRVYIELILDSESKTISNLENTNEIRIATFVIVVIENLRERPE